MASKMSHRYEYHRFRRPRGGVARTPTGQSGPPQSADSTASTAAATASAHLPTAETTSLEERVSKVAAASSELKSETGRGRGRGNNEYHRFRRPRGGVARTPGQPGPPGPPQSADSTAGTAAATASADLPTAETTSLEEGVSKAAAASSEPKSETGRGRGRGNTAPRRPRVCKYFVADGYCYFGDDCRFYHPRNQATRPAPRPLQSSSKPIARPNQVVLSLDQLKSEAQRAARQSEIDALKRRFPSHRSLSSTDKEIDSFLIDFAASDPDWPFDVKTVGLQVTFPSGYPIDCALMETSDSQLPELLIRSLNTAIGDWLRTCHEKQELKNAFEPIMRTFLRWLDRSILSLFIEGLRKTKMVVDAQSAGISLAVLPKVSAPTVSASTADTAPEIAEDTNASEAPQSPQPTLQAEQSTSQSEQSTNNEADSAACEKLSTLTFSTDKVPGSTEIRLTSCHLGENVASLTPVKLTLSVQCGRCPTHGEMTVSSGSRTISASCSQCSQRWSLDWMPGMVHSGSIVLGQLVPTGCRPIDLVLVTSEFRLACLQCNKEMMLKSVSYGAPFKTWCQGCHSKSELTINAVRFYCETPLEGNIATATGPAKSVKKKPTAQGPRIVEGQPLPDNGTCKHYKKSFRWFRFPCCGKVYPCDLCHEESESHEMKFANRIVCGFCSKEQPYQNSKVCSSCKGSVVRAKTTHWEGGKGCRDSTKMAKGDDRKYSNSRLKTVSRQKQSELATKTTKKKTDD